MRMEFQGTKPERTRDGDSAYDLRANLELAVRLATGEREVIPLGTRLAIPDGWVGLVVPRSGLAARHGITVVNTPGVIDSNYRGRSHGDPAQHGRSTVQDRTRRQGGPTADREGRATRVR